VYGRAEADDRSVAHSRRLFFCVLLTAALSITGCGNGHRHAGAVLQTSAPRSSTAPTEADFVGYPSCLLYLVGADTRLRVRASHARHLCLRLAERYSMRGSRWSPRPRRAEQILSPICRMASPRASVELDVIDNATGNRPGAQICTSLVRAGWLDLSPP
jgi:hypothetical protein